LFCVVVVRAGSWRLEAGGWRLEAGGWRLEAGGWRLEAGGWRLIDVCGGKSSLTVHYSL
jgi:hypothetical protein